MSARTRRSLTLLWTALFVLSLGLQYMTFAAPPSALAVHDDGIFELDGDAVAGPAPGTDWDQVVAGTSGADEWTFVDDGVPERAFTGGGSKDDLDTDQWAHTLTNVPDKDDLLDGFAALFGDVIYFGADRYANNGDAQVGFWFFKNGININANGTFTPVHSVGDLLVVSHFTNGGAASSIELFEWVGSGGDTNGTLDLLATGQNCTEAPATDKACAVANATEEPAPWAYTPKSGPSGTFPINAFFEGGLDLSEVYGGTPPCFSSFLVETRSSQEVDATLKDFVAGAFNTCEPPVITTTASVSTINVGESVTDTADFTANSPAVTGSVDFYVCGPDASATACTSGGTKVGATKTISAGTAVSDPFPVTDPAMAGFYCFRAVYTPDQAASNFYIGGSHTNATTECFEVLPADISITKTADAASVNAGEPIGFTVTITNGGSGLATGLSFSDPLPGGSGISWSIDPASTGWSITGSAPNQSLVYSPTTLAGNSSTSVHVVSDTTKDSCAVYDNTATVSSTNDGGGSASASTEVLCATVTIAKTADAPSVNAGDPIGFTVTLTNSTAGLATGLSFSDPLPGGSGISWSIDPASTGWSITGSAPNQSLVYSPTTLAGNSSTSVHVVSDTTAASCGIYDNTASFTTDNDGSGEASASTEVLCADLEVVKTGADAVTIGDQTTFTIEVTNHGPNDAVNAEWTDELPAGTTFVSLAQTSGAAWSCTTPAVGSGGTISCTLATFAAEASATFDLVVQVTLDATCGAEIVNTAVVSADTTDPDPSNNSDSHAVTVDCPDITVEKTADVTPIDAGDSASFTIEVWNAGPGIAYGATLTDTLPAGTWVVDNIDPNGVTGPVTCDPIVGGVLTCDLGTMEPGRGANSVFITIARQTSVAECTAGDYSLLNSVVVAATNEPAAAPLPNEDSATIDVLCPELGISKESDNEGPVSAGDQVGFTVTIVNSGTGSATGVSVDDPLPAGLDWTLVAADTDAGWTLSGPVGSQVLSFAGSLAAGQASSAHVIATSDAADCGSIPNLASLYQDEVFVDDDDAAEVVLCAAIDLTKTADDAAVIAGDQIGFTLTVTNTGEGAAKDVHVADPLPTDPGLAWTIAVPVDGWSIVGGELVYDAATLAGGASSSVHVVSPTTRATCGAVDNTGTVTTSNDGTDSASASVTVICPALTLEKSNDAPIETIDLGGGITVDLPTLEEGDSATFTLVYTLVDGPVDNGVLTDVLPEGMAYVDGTASSNGEFSFVGYDEATRTLRWEAETVTESGTLTYEAQAQEGASDLAQPLVNVATIDSDQTEPDSDDSDVFVPIVEAVTSSPSITPPPTDTFAPATQAPSNPGFALMLVLLGLAGFALTLGFITPVPERIRRRDRRS